MKTTLSFTVLTVLTVLLICGEQRIADAQVFDGNWEGPAIGGGVGYAAATGEILGSAGFTPFGRIGYGFSDGFILYFSSSLPSIAPAIGVLYSPDRYARYYFQGTLGYESFGEDSLMSLSGGFGYELRDHVMLELSLGFNRFTNNSWTGERYTEVSQTNIITLAAIFNFFLY